MAPDLSPRCPGTAIPEAVRDAAAQAGRRRRPLDPRVLRRVRDALVRLPDHALTRHYFEVPGESLDSPATAPPIGPGPPLGASSERRA